MMDWRALADLTTVIIGVGCIAIAATSAVASTQVAGMAAIDLERRALGFGTLGLVLLLLGCLSEAL
jgi:hypothetical protein